MIKNTNKNLKMYEILIIMDNKRINLIINIVMPSDKTQLVQGTVSIIGNNTNKIREYSFSNYAYNIETINITDFNEPCRVTVRVEGRGTSQQNRIVTYTIN